MGSVYDTLSGVDAGKPQRGTPFPSVIDAPRLRESNVSGAHSINERAQALAPAARAVPLRTTSG